MKWFKKCVSSLPSLGGPMLRTGVREPIPGTSLSLLSTHHSEVARNFAQGEDPSCSICQDQTLWAVVSLGLSIPVIVFMVASVTGAAPKEAICHGFCQVPAHECSDDFGGLASRCLRVRDGVSSLSLFRLEEFSPLTSKEPL